MNSFLIGKLLILLMLLPVVTRPIFKKQNKVDTIVFLVPVAFSISWILLFTAGLSFSVLYVFFVSLFVLLTNLNALSRFISDLRIDIYSPLSIILSVVSFFMILGAFAVVILSNPYLEMPKIQNMKASFTNISKETFKKTGNFEKGFTSKETFDQKANVIFNVFYDANFSEQELAEAPVVIFLGDVFANTQENFGTIQAIALQKNVVIAADFYVNDGEYLPGLKNRKFCRSFLLRFKYARNKDELNQFVDSWQNIKQKELNEIISFAKEYNKNAKIACIAADGNAIISAKKYLAQTNQQIPLFEINEKIPGYISGMGNIAMFERLVYKKLTDNPMNGKTQANQIALRLEKIKK